MSFKPETTNGGHPCKRCSQQGRLCYQHDPDAQSAHQTRAREERQASQDAFLEEYARLGCISGAAKAAEVGRRTHYDWLEADPEYRERFEDAREEAADMLELEARRRAVSGVQEPVFYKGVRVATVRKYSDRLLEFLLKAARPAKYRERHEITGPEGGPLVITRIERVVVDPANGEPDEE